MLTTTGEQPASANMPAETKPGLKLLMHRHSLMWLAIFGVVTLMFLRIPPMVATQDAVTNTYSALVEVDALAKQKYVEPIEGQRLVHGAIRGLLRELDPYSGYISPAQLKAFERRSQGAYIGIGVEIGVRQGRLTVIAPIESGPAMVAGIRAGDAILEIDGRETKGMSVFDVEELLGGPPGTTVRIHVQHGDDSEPKTFEVVRGPVALQTVRGFARNHDRTWDHWIDRTAGIGYIRVSNFFDNTMEDFEDTLDELVRAGDLKGLIIDLRFNPGGIMPQAIKMVDRFIPEGLILSTVTRRNAVREYFATSENTITDLNLAVLINNHSASAAEIVAGALQDHTRAAVFGERSFGKGSVQHLIHLTESGGAIKLTTAHYRLPSGRVIHRFSENENLDEWGVIPDVVIPTSYEERKAIREARHALDVKTTATIETRQATLASHAAATLPLDPQLQAALDWIRDPKPSRPGT